MMIRHVSLGATIEAALAVTVVLFACGSSSLLDADRIGHSTRWAALFLVFGLSSVAARRAVQGDALPWSPFRFALLPLAFVVVAFLSASWSARPRLTLERTTSFAVLLAAAVALAIASYGDLDLRRRILAGLAAGAAFVGFAGVVMAIAGLSQAVQPAGAGNPGRFEGFGQNPNTVAVLAAVTVPIITWLALTSVSVRTRVGWQLSFLILFGTTVASESRGGLVATFLGTAVVLGLLVGSTRSKIAAIALLAVVVVVGVGVREWTTQAPAAFVSSVQPGITGTASGSAAGGASSGAGSTSSPKSVAGPLPARSDEIGNPGLSTHAVSTLGSGRIAAWLGALNLVRDRPLLGYGFGTEEVVFVDRWYFFQGARPENSLLGILLQVGLIGLLPLLAFLGILVRNGVRGIRSRVDVVRTSVAGPLGVLAAAIVLVFFQSYVYSVGNVATVTVWIVLCLLGAGIKREAVISTGV